MSMPNHVNDTDYNREPYPNEKWLAVFSRR